MTTYISFSSMCFCYYRKHPNNNTKICSLPPSSCFQQNFHHRFYALRYNSDLSKLESTQLLFSFNYILDLTNRHKSFSISVAEYASFSYQAKTLETNLLGLIPSFHNITLKQAQLASFSYLHMYLSLQNLIAIILVSNF